MKKELAFVAASAMMLSSSPIMAETGIASHYYSGGRVACPGIRGEYTAAHRTIPCGTKVTVTNNKNGKSVVVTINDRGPFVSGRIIDLSTEAAEAIGISGLGNVTIDW